MIDSVSLFVHDLDRNPVARVLPFVKGFRRLGVDVEVLGLVTKKSTEVHLPYRDEVDPKIVYTTKRLSDFLPNMRRLAHAATGDAVYAFKPLMTTLSPALYAARIVEDRPLLLDVEDEEVYGQESWSVGDAWTKLFREWRTANAWKYTRLLQLLRTSVDAVTVVSKSLQEQYGGTILRHGPDEEEFNPDGKFENKGSLCRKWGLPVDRKLAMFTGTPRSHKGIDTLVDALLLPQAKEWDFVLVGPVGDELADTIENKLPERSHLLGAQPYQEIPELLSVADVVPIPQKQTPFAEAQVPAKLLDAMAMRCPIVATRVGDLPEILGYGERGWIVEPDCPLCLAESLEAIANNTEEREKRAQKSREWYSGNASVRSISISIKEIIQNIKHTS